MNIISIKRNAMRRAHRIHVLRGRPRMLNADVRGDAVHEISFRVPGEGERDYILLFTPDEIDAMHRELESARNRP